MLGGGGKAQIAAAAGIATVVIALVTGIAMYIQSYFTESLGQCVGNDLRVRRVVALAVVVGAHVDAHSAGRVNLDLCRL